MLNSPTQLGSPLGRYGFTTSKQNLNQTQLDFKGTVSEKDFLFKSDTPFHRWMKLQQGEVLPTKATV